MSLTGEDRNILVGLQIEKAQAMLLQMQVGIEHRMWDMVANRVYYAVFHAVSALLINSEIEVGSHKGAAIRFQKHFVKTGIFSPQEAHMYSRLQQLREEGDYNCYIQTSEEEIMAYIEPAREFIAKIESMIG